MDGRMERWTFGRSGGCVGDGAGKSVLGMTRLCVN